MEYEPPICLSCARRGPRPDGAEGVACTAFPNGIPDAIWLEGFDHRQPFPGDGGVRFRLAPGRSDALDRYEASLTGP